LSEKDIREYRKRYGKPLLVFVPINPDPEKYEGISNEEPIIGFGLMFPIIDSEKKFEYAARPLNPEFEEEVQQSDDKADDE
jgi:hypothetical protein